MKKIKDIDYYEIILYILIFVLLLISFSIFLNFLGLNIYNQNQIDANKDQISVILALSTIVLVLITINYAKSTKELLDEQVKKRQIESIEKVLENIYSPILIALNQFMLNCESLPENKIPEVYNSSFKELNDVIMNIASKYYHLINQKIINYYNIELWKAWLKYSSNPDIDNYKLLNSRIKMFGDYITKQLNLEKESLNKLQQLGETMVVNERQIGRTQNDCPLSTKEWISFLNNEISSLKNEGFQNSNNLFPVISLFAVLATGVITWTLSTANANNPPYNREEILSLFNSLQTPLYILFTGIVLVYTFSIFKNRFKNWEADKLRDIRNNIMNGGLIDTNEILEKWSNVMLLTYKEYIKSLF